MTRTSAFAREQLRTPSSLALLVAVPAVFVIASAGVLSDFAAALGGRLAGDAASALGAGWAAAFIAGTLGYFQASSSRAADRRLVLAGSSPWRVAASRIFASLLMALIATAAAYIALRAHTGLVHPWHAAVAIGAFAVIYLAVGVTVGSLIADPLEGALTVTFIFLLDVFSGPGMAADAAPWSVSRKAADLLIAAGVGHSSPASDWLALGAVIAAALGICLVAFAWAARGRA